jgi:radical SAM protein with 4Fe4S-binding SPASM domain
MAIFFSSLLTRYARPQIVLYEALNQWFRLFHSPKAFRLTTAGIETNNTCNLHCSHCPTPNEMKRKKGLMDLDTFKQIIDLNPELARIYLTNWGEPLIHPHIVEMVSYAHAKGKHTAITTNGTTLDRELSRDLLENGLDLIKFSVDGDKETYQKIRGFSYEKVESNIKEFLDVRNSLGKKTWVEVSMLVFEETQQEIERFLKKWNSLADFANLQPKFFTIKRKKYKPCRDLWRILVVLWNGDVVPCCADYEGAMALGDARKTNLQKIFNGSAMTELRKKHIQKNPPSLCASCSPYYADYHISAKSLPK